MVICIVYGCSKRSDRDKDVSFYRIPVIRKDQGLAERQLSERRRQGFLAAISRDDLTDSKIENGRICLRHFISGKPADLYDHLNPVWLPTLNLGHSKIKPTVGDRYERAVRKRAQISDTSDDEEDPTFSSEVACQTDESGDSILQLVQELRDKLSRLESVILAGCHSFRKGSNGSSYRCIHSPLHWTT